MTVSLSLDRLTLVLDVTPLNQSDNDLSLNLPELANDFVDTFNEFVPATDLNMTVIAEHRFKGSELYLVELDKTVIEPFYHKRHPLLNISTISEHPGWIRIDLNPKRFREWDWLLNSLRWSLLLLKNSGVVFNEHMTQVDLAFDMIDEGASAQDISLLKLGSTKAKVMYSRKSAVATTYYGKRTSDSFAKKYDKRQEQYDAIVNKYRSEKVRFNNLLKNGKITEEDLSGLIMDMDNSKETEVNALPKSHWRFEITLRTPLFLDEKTLDPLIVENRYLSKLAVREINTISDPVLRSLAHAVENDVITKSEIPGNLALKYSAIMKYPDISAGYNKSKRFVVFDTKNVAPDFNVTYRAQRDSEDKLANTLLELWNSNFNTIQNEINQYFV